MPQTSVKKKKVGILFLLLKKPKQHKPEQNSTKNKAGIPAFYIQLQTQGQLLQLFHTLPLVLSRVEEMQLNCLSELEHASELDPVNAVAVSDSCLIALDDTIWH